MSEIIEYKSEIIMDTLKNEVCAKIGEQASSYTTLTSAENLMNWIKNLSVEIHLRKLIL